MEEAAALIRRWTTVWDLLLDGITIWEHTIFYQKMQLIFFVYLNTVWIFQD